MKGKRVEIRMESKGKYITTFNDDVAEILVRKGLTHLFTNEADSIKEYIFLYNGETAELFSDEELGAINGSINFKDKFTVQF
jgi:hypothetical protein